MSWLGVLLRFGVWFSKVWAWGSGVRVGLMGFKHRIPGSLLQSPKGEPQPQRPEKVGDSGLRLRVLNLNFMV